MTFRALKAILDDWHTIGKVRQQQASDAARTWLIAEAAPSVIRTQEDHEHHDPGGLQGDA